MFRNGLVKDLKLWMKGSSSRETFPRMLKIEGIKGRFSPFLTIFLSSSQNILNNVHFFIFFGCQFVPFWIWESLIDIYFKVLSILFSKIPLINLYILILGRDGLDFNIRVLGYFDGNHWLYLNFMFVDFYLYLCANSN